MSVRNVLKRQFWSKNRNSVYFRFLTDLKSRIVWLQLPAIPENKDKMVVIEYYVVISSLWSLSKIFIDNPKELGYMNYCGV